AQDRALVQRLINGHGRNREASSRRLLLRQDSRSRLRPGLSPGRPAPAAVAGTAVVPVKPVRAAPLASLPVAPLRGHPRRDFLAGHQAAAGQVDAPEVVDLLDPGLEPLP